MLTDGNGYYSQTVLDELAPTIMIARQIDGRQFDILEYHKNYSSSNETNYANNHAKTADEIDMTDKEKIAYAKGMAQAYFDIAMTMLNGTHNYKDLQDYCFNKSNEIDEGIKKWEFEIPKLKKDTIAYDNFVELINYKFDIKK